MKPINDYLRVDGSRAYPRAHDNQGLEQLHIDYRAAEQGSAMLLEALERQFSKWERRHGFQEGAAKLLLPNGYNPDRPFMLRRVA